MDEEELEEEFRRVLQEVFNVGGGTLSGFIGWWHGQATPIPPKPISAPQQINPGWECQTISQSVRTPVGGRRSGR